MAFPGKKAGTEYSFGEPKGMAKEHEVTRPPAVGKYKGKYELTMAQYANIEDGEERGERNVKAPHISHSK